MKENNEKKGKMSAVLKRWEKLRRKEKKLIIGVVSLQFQRVFLFNANFWNYENVTWANNSNIQGVFGKQLFGAKKLFETAIYQTHV